MSAVKWAFAIGALMIGAVLVGISPNLLGLDLGMPKMPEKKDAPAESAATEAVPEPAASVSMESAEPVAETPVEPVPEPTPVEPAPIEPAPVEPIPVEPIPVEPAPEPSQVVDYDLVSHWKFDDNLDNFGTAGIAGFAVGTEKYMQGKTGSAFDFDGNSYLRVLGVSQLGNPSFSVTFWVNPDQLRTQGIIDKISAEGWSSGWRIFMTSASGNIEFDAAGEVANIATPPIATGTWSLVAVTYDSGTQTAKIYLDGVLSAQASGVDMQNDLPNNIIVASLEDARLDGRLDDVRFYNVALGDFQIQDIYDSIA